MKKLALLLLHLLSLNLLAQMERFPLLEPIENTIPESFIIEGGTNELIMFWIDSTDLHMSKSLDGGTNWNLPTTLVDNESILDSLSDLNALKLKNDRIIVTYKFKYHYLIYSDDYGTNWSEPIKLVTDIGTVRPRRVMESSLSQTDDNKIWFVYNRLNLVYAITSTDGETWSEKDTLLTLSNSSPHFSSINSHWDGSLVLIFQQNFSDTTDIYQSKSIDGGVVWDAPQLMFDDGFNKVRPRVFRDSDKTLWITFSEKEATPFENFSQTNVFYSKLINNSASRSPLVKFTSFTGFDAWQNISSANGKPYISFISNRISGLTSWFGIADESIDSKAPPSVYETILHFTNNYPQADVNINSKIYNSEIVKKAMFHYTWGSKVDSIELFDDGLHNDKEANDFIFGNDFLNLNYNFSFTFFITATDMSGNRTITESEKVYSPFPADGNESFYFDNNNIKLPINSRGVIADVWVTRELPIGGRFDDKVFLFSGGFALSGYTNGNLWANGVMPSSRVEDYISGNIDSTVVGNLIYIVRTSQPDFYLSWYEWKDAVKLGAKFYDGDGDGVYNPVDLNNNGVWDENEDKPNIIGDVTAFTVFNDGLPTEFRTFPGAQPQGIEIKQTVFSYNKTTSPELANVIFIKYNIENVGTVADKLDSVYFGSWADFDIGDPYDDLVGTDTTLNTIYTYNSGSDKDFGINPPACFISLVQGAPVYIEGETFIDVNGDGKYNDGVDTPLDTAKSKNGELIDIVKYPGAKNNKLLSSRQYISSHPTVGDPQDEAHLRNYMLGYNKEGELADPCNWEFGKIFNDDCSSITNPKFIYSGDPVSKNGWINIQPNEQKHLASTGPFNLIKGEPIEIIIAYIVGRGVDSLSSITEARKITNDAIGFYNTNFSYVPVGVRQNEFAEIPTQFELMQNYPNPFNPSTTIKYSIPTNVSGESLIVSLKIYDILGREVATLVNKRQNAGNYEMKFNASNLTSGVYFYRLQSGSYVESKKMILLK